MTELSHDARCRLISTEDEAREARRPTRSSVLLGGGRGRKQDIGSRPTESFEANGMTRRRFTVLRHTPPQHSYFEANGNHSLPKPTSATRATHVQSAEHSIGKAIHGGHILLCRDETGHSLLTYFLIGDEVPSGVAATRDRPILKGIPSAVAWRQRIAAAS